MSCRMFLWIVWHVLVSGLNCCVFVTVYYQATCWIALFNTEHALAIVCVQACVCVYVCAHVRSQVIYGPFLISRLKMLLDSLSSTVLLVLPPVHPEKASHN